MARKYPRTVPDSVKSKAERLLFEELEVQLPDEYDVFHGVRWQEPSM